ncbi:hypothetical protein C7410_15722, partial [Paraburkholderia silvatlantica]
PPAGARAPRPGLARTATVWVFFAAVPFVPARLDAPLAHDAQREELVAGFHAPSLT